MAYVYKNESDQEQIVMGAGIWKAGEQKESPVKIENPNFRLIGSEQKVSEEMEGEDK